MAKGSGGRPTKYKPEYPKQAAKLCALGATDAQLAEFFEVSEQTVNAWKDEYPEFLESIKAAKAEYDDATVEKSLLRRATGYSHEAVKIFNDEGTPLIVPYTEHYPPDPTSMIFWLKNRQPKKWRDKTGLEIPEGASFKLVIESGDE